MHLSFDDATHTYTLNGAIVPSVTKIIAPMTSYFRVPLDRLQLAADRGTAVHRLTEAYDRGQESLWDAPVELDGYLDAWMAFRIEHEFAPDAIEERVYSEKYGYAGTIDRVGWLHGELVILDIKTGTHLGPAVGVQCAGYQLAANEMYPNGTRITGRVAVQLKADGTYVLHEYRNPFDEAAFLACLALWEWQQVSEFDFTEDSVRLVRPPFKLVRTTREMEIEALVRAAAAEARMGTPQTLPPMNLRERRAVHELLSGDVELTTESTGEGANRCVTIRRGEE